MTDFTVLILWVVGIAAVFALWCLRDAKAQKRRAEKFQDRPSFDFDEWYDRYGEEFQGISPAHVEAILGIFAAWIGTEATRLRPSDRLAEDLCLRDGNLEDDSLIVWSEQLKKYARNVTGTALELRDSWETLGEVIRAVGLQFGGKNGMDSTPSTTDSRE